MEVSSEAAGLVDVAIVGLHCGRCRSVLNASPLVWGRDRVGWAVLADCGWWIVTEGVGVASYGCRAEICAGVGESGRALLDTPPFAKSAKGRAPGVVAARRRTNTGVLHCVQDDEI